MQSFLNAGADYKYMQPIIKACVMGYLFHLSLPHTQSFLPVQLQKDIKLLNFKLKYSNIKVLRYLNYENVKFCTVNMIYVLKLSIIKRYGVLPHTTPYTNFD